MELRLLALSGECEMETVSDAFSVEMTAAYLKLLLSHSISLPLKQSEDLYVQLLKHVEKSSV